MIFTVQIPWCQIDQLDCNCSQQQVDQTMTNWSHRMQGIMALGAFSPDYCYPNMGIRTNKTSLCCQYKASPVTWEIILISYDSSARQYSAWNYCQPSTTTIVPLTLEQETYLRKKWRHLLYCGTYSFWTRHIAETYRDRKLYLTAITTMFMNKWQESLI